MSKIDKLLEVYAEASYAVTERGYAEDTVSLSQAKQNILDYVDSLTEVTSTLDSTNSLESNNT